MEHQRAVNLIKEICGQMIAEHEENRHKRKKKAYETRFEEFYSAYPVKKGKGQAEKTWQKINPDDILMQDIIKGAKKLKAEYDKLPEDRRRFVKHPSTWLNAKGWEDEYDEGKPVRPSPKCAHCGCETVTGGVGRKAHCGKRKCRAASDGVPDMWEQYTKYGDWE